VDIKLCLLKNRTEYQTRKSESLFAYPATTKISSTNNQIFQTPMENPPTITNPKHEARNPKQARITKYSKLRWKILYFGAPRSLLEGTSFAKVGENDLTQPPSTTPHPFAFAKGRLYISPTGGERNYENMTTLVLSLGEIPLFGAPKSRPGGNSVAQRERSHHLARCFSHPL
jgi:hypothetical protein